MPKPSEVFNHQRPVWLVAAGGRLHSPRACTGTMNQFVLVLVVLLVLEAV